jgi:hypothetical protein
MKYLFSLFFVFFFLKGFSQEKSIEKVTLHLNNATIQEALNLLEKKTEYYFYYSEEWFAKSNNISGVYKDKSVQFILDSIFNNTIFNFYVYKRNIYITRNNFINDSFSGLVFNVEKKNNSTETTIPIYYSNNNENLQKGNDIVRIGKETKNNKQKSFVLKGIVKNSETGEPIPQLAIIERKKNINTITDEKGRYTITLPIGLNILETQSLGYVSKKKNFIVYNNGEYNFIVNESTQQLDELIIATNVDKNVKEVITGITSIKVEDIKTIPLILGERDILKVATAIPGIKSAGEGASGLNVRGGREDQNLFLLDNGVLYNPQHFFGIFSAINPFTTGDVDIYKGTIPAQFGGRISSVFDIKTKNGSVEKFKGEASLGPLTSNVSLEIPLKKEKSSIIIGGRGTYSDWILSTLDDPGLSQSSASFYDFNTKYTNQINEKNKIEASAYYSNDKFSISSDSLQQYNNRIFSFGWKHNFTDKNYGELTLANSKYNFSISFDENSVEDFDLDYEIMETELKYKVRQIFQKHKLTYGVSSKLYNISPGNIAPLGEQSTIIPLEIPEEKGLESAVFVSDTYEINDKLSVNAGLRLSMFNALGAATQNIYDSDFSKSEATVVGTEEFGNNEVIKTYGGPEFRLSTRYSLSESSSVKLSYNSTYQYIHKLSNNTTASPVDAWRLSSLHIKPQRGNQYSLGYFKNIDGNDYEFSLEGYYKTFKDIIDYKVGADLLLNQFVETEIAQGNGLAYGAEVLLKKNKGRLNGWIGYSYSRSFIKLDGDFPEERVNNGNYFPANFDKPHDLNVIANWKLTKRYSFSGNFTYQTGRPVTYPIGTFVFNGAERVLYSDRNRFRIPDYYRLDLGINIEGNHKLKKLAHSFWNISVYNVLGRNNPFSVFFVTESGDIKAYQSSIFAVPVPTISYNIKF